MKTGKYTLLILMLLSMAVTANGREHPCLILTRNAVETIAPELGKVPLLDSSLLAIRQKLDRIIDEPLDIPFPKDAGGGYTHEQHKRNYTSMYQAGVLYQLYKEDRYAEYVKKCFWNMQHSIPDSLCTRYRSRVTEDVFSGRDSMRVYG